MLPHLLSDTYKQYKEDTEQFLKWLAETAVDCGHVPTSFQPLTKGPRLKGKDRKKAKVAEANGAPATQHTVAIKEMIPLARSIAGSKNAVEVPTNILSLCRRAIAARERCTTWYRGKAVEQIDVEKSTRDHSYFVGVLKDVLNILESYIALHQPGSKQGKGYLGLAIKHAKKQTSEDQRTKWTNKNAFESLAVDEVGSEEVSFEDEDIAKTKNPLNTTPGQYPSRSKVNFQPESSAGDVEFAIFCVLEDLGCIRRFLTKTWSDYHTGSISLINASLTTNTAIEFVRRIDEDFRAWFPECTDYQSTMKLVLPMVCALHGLDPSNIDCVHWEVEDFIYYDPFFNLREFRDAFEDAGDGKRLILEPLHDLFYDPRFDREGISEQERRANDRILLREIFPEFLILIVNGTLPTEDTITQGFRNMILEKRIYLWVVFGMQIFLDIHHTLGEHISRGLQEFRATTAQVKVTVDESCRYARSLGGKWCENNADYLKELQWNGDFIKTWVTDDALMNMRLKSTAGFDFSRHGVGKPYLLLRQHPLMCGLQMLALELKIQQGSVAYANNHGYVIAAAHLYNAVQKQGYLQLSWPEMDRLINLYTPEAIFVGPVPITPQDFYKRYLLAEGASIEYFARNRRVDKTKRIPRSKKGPLRFGENSAFIRVVRNHLCKYEGQVGTTLEEVENLLSNSSPLQTQKHTFQKLNPLQLLARLQECVDEEEPTIHYDHLAMYRNSLAMLRRIESTVPGLHETFSAWWSASRPSLKNLSLDATLYALPEYLLTKLSGNEGIAMARSGQSMLADTAGIIELCILQDQDTKRSETSTSEPPEATDASEYSPPTQWGKSDSGHPTRNGECLHVGVCQRQINEWAKTMTRLAQYAPGALWVVLREQRSSSAPPQPNLESLLDYSSNNPAPPHSSNDPFIPVSDSSTYIFIILMMGQSLMPQKLRLAVAQSRSLATTSATLSALETQAHHAARSGIHLILFPEAYLGGYPRSCTFGACVGSRADHGREQFLRYFHSAVDFGDTPAESGDKWVEKRLPVGKGKDYRGDGTREVLERVARETGVFLVVGAVERAGGSLYCAVVYICPKEGCLGKRRKVMPTGSERLIWAQGSPSTLRAVTTTIAGVNLTLAAAICWENYMPLLRFSLYSQNVNLYLAPTADARETWVPLMQTIACEGRCFVLSANQCMRRKNLPDWIKEAEATSGSESKPSEAAADAPRKQARRSSIITRTEDNHEISWPSPETTTTSASKDYFPTTSEGSKDAYTNDVPQKIPRRASVITRTEDNHEITWPSADAKPPTNPATATSHIANGFFPSPLRTSAVPNDNPATPSQQPLSHQNTPPQNLTTTNSDPSPDDPEELVSRGGSVIVSPTGSILAGPLWDVEDGGMLVVSVDFQDCERGRLDLDVAGSYSRQDAFKLEVVGLDISPPP